MELEIALEVSYNDNYCPEARAERRRGAADGGREAGEVVGIDCVDRHTFFITPLSSSRCRSAFASHHQAQPLPQPRPARTATEARLGRESSSSSTCNSSLRLSQACAAQEGCGSGAARHRICRRNRQECGAGKCSRALIGFSLEAGPPAHLAGHRRSYSDAVLRPSVPVCPLLPCEAGGAHQHRSSFIALSAVRRCHRRLIRRIRTPEFAVLNECMNDSA